MSMTIYFSFVNWRMVRRTCNLMGVFNGTSWAGRSDQPNVKRGKYRALHCSGCVCLSQVFLLCHDLWKKQLINIQKHIHVYGIKPRTHENVNRKPKHVLTVEVTKSVVTILTNYAAQHGLLMPVAPPSSNGVPLFTATCWSDRSVCILLVQNSLQKRHGHPCCWPGKLSGIS